VSAIFESRLSDSPYVEIIWRGRVEQDYPPVCPADVRWNLLFVKEQGKYTVTAEGATTQHVPKVQFAGREFLVIKFKLGVYMPYLPANHLVDGDALLPEATSKTFWLNGASWQVPDFENVEAFVDRMVYKGVLLRDPLVPEVLQNHPQDVSPRTIRRHFVRSTGLTPGLIAQIERAKRAASLLERGVSILDAVYEVGYADQPHLTRSLRRYIGQTPAQIARVLQPE